MSHFNMSQPLLTQASVNRLWARLILLSLYRQGVRHFCIAPGSRSTPLTLEAIALAEQYPSVCLHKHFDERGLGFLALGIAKSEAKGVAVIVTSGTAVANLLPAVAESGLTKEKLILLTADRPQELIQCGANQAIVQQNIFSTHVSSACYLPTPSADISPKWLLATLSEHLALQASGGSLHINCPYKEPLYGGLEVEQQSAIHDYLAPVQSFLDNSVPYLPVISAKESDFSAISAAWQELQHKKGAIIVGQISDSDKKAISELSQKLGWPMLCDPQAGMLSEYAHFDLWLQNSGCLALFDQCEFILQFGARLVSKRLGQFLATFKQQYWLVEHSASRLDPHHLSMLRIKAKPKRLIGALPLEKIKPNPWGAALTLASENTHKLAKSFVTPCISELGMAQDLANWLIDDTALFIGNSMTIRLIDMLSRRITNPVFANRGASGIDGLIATALGVQLSIQKPMLCLLGDISALYDLNSLALLTECEKPFVLIIINNAGCGIFDLLPVPKENKTEFYRMTHQLSFRHAAKMFNLHYFAPKTVLDVQNCCLQAQKTSGATLIELKVPEGEVANSLKQLFTLVANEKLI